PGFAKNPVGCGRCDGPAPNIEDPARPDEPAGFGPLAPTWAPRKDLIGTYNGDYRKTRWPWFPKDFDWAHFNAAPRDQQLDQHPRGDEELTLENLHPKSSNYRCKLPGLRVRGFVQDIAPDDPRRFREVPLVLDTLWVDADRELLVLT